MTSGRGAPKCARWALRVARSRACMKAEHRNACPRTPYPSIYHCLHRPLYYALHTVASHAALLADQRPVFELQPKACSPSFVPCQGTDCLGLDVRTLAPGKDTPLRPAGLLSCLSRDTLSGARCPNLCPRQGQPAATSGGGHAATGSGGAAPRRLPCVAGLPPRAHVTTLPGPLCHPLSTPSPLPYPLAPLINTNRQPIFRAYPLARALDSQVRSAQGGTREHRLPHDGGRSGESMRSGGAGVSRARWRLRGGAAPTSRSWSCLRCAQTPAAPDLLHQIDNTRLAIMLIRSVIRAHPGEEFQAAVNSSGVAIVYAICSVHCRPNFA